MSVSGFSEAVRTNAYKDWLAKLNSSLINKSVKELRSSQQVASKTDFLLTKDSLKDIYETLSGSKLDFTDISIMMAQLAGTLGTATDNTKVGVKIKVDGKDALLFKDIGFDTISTVLNRVLKTPEIDENLAMLSMDAQDAAKAALKAKYGKKIPRDEFNKADNIKLTIGDFFDKGHVVSIAANLGKEFAKEIQQASVLSAPVKEHLLKVLQQYVDKLVADDLASANLPNAVTQEIYGDYIKSNEKYLVEFQVKKKNQLSGSDSAPILVELRKIFSGIEIDALESIAKNNKLGQALVFSEGSPSYADILVKGLVNIIEGKKKDKTVYKIAPVKVLTNTVKIIKPKKNTKEIAAAKRLISKLKTAKVKNNVPKIDDSSNSLATLEFLLRNSLYQQIVKNMGTGNSRNVLNFRSGRLAESAKIERLTQSREGMVSVFYSYMRNPYGTFSEGGAKEFPRSRDPKTLISKSIREIGATAAYTRMRAVLI